MRETTESLRWRSSCCNIGSKSQVGVQRWRLYQSPWEKDWVKRMRSCNNAGISQGTYLHLGMVSIQRLVWGLITFISDLVGEASLCSSKYMLGADDWLPVRSSWGLLWIESGKWSKNVLSLWIGWTTYWATLGGMEQSGQGRLLSHSIWCWWAAPGIKCQISGPPSEKCWEAGEGFPGGLPRYFRS